MQKLIAGHITHLDLYLHLIIEYRYSNTDIPVCYCKLSCTGMYGSTTLIPVLFFTRVYRPYISVLLYNLGVPVY
jgi:hypothetical protein